MAKGIKTHRYKNIDETDFYQNSAFYCAFTAPISYISKRGMCNQIPSYQLVYPNSSIKFSVGYEGSLGAPHQQKQDQMSD